jgi:hypothetical protein
MVTGDISKIERSLQYDPCLFNMEINYSWPPRHRTSLSIPEAAVKTSWLQLPQVLSFAGYCISTRRKQRIAFSLFGNVVSGDLLSERRHAGASAIIP